MMEFFIKGQFMLKKIIYFFGAIFLALITGLNLIFTASLDNSEHITISTNGIFYVIGLLITVFLIFGINKFLNYKFTNKKKKNLIFKISIIFYALFNIVWCIVVRPAIVADQIHACNLAQTFYSGDDSKFLFNQTYAGIPLIEYIQAYYQQITLAFVFSIFFKIIHFDGIGILRVLNIIGNLGIVFALFKICTQLDKKYKTNKVLLLFLIFTFFSLTMLSTFIYGDIPSIALCLFSVYFMMKYVENKKISNAILASFLTMIAYMMRMNSLIFIIATVMYLLFSFFNNFKTHSLKHNIVELIIVFTYILISILPSNLVKSYYINKYNLDRTKAYPSISYFLMAMEESPRANGWYNESIGEPALKNPQEKKVEYVDEIKNRLNYFKDNPRIFF